MAMPPVVCSRVFKDQRSQVVLEKNHYGKEMERGRGRWGVSLSCAMVKSSQSYAAIAALLPLLLLQAD